MSTDADPSIPYTSPGTERHGASNANGEGRSRLGIFRHPAGWILHLLSEFRGESPREQLAIAYYSIGVGGVLIAGILGAGKLVFPHGGHEAPNLLAITQAVAKDNTPEDARRATERLTRIVGALTTLRQQEPALAANIDAAFTDLAKGATDKAEALLRTKIAQNSGDDAADRRKRAEYHRYLAGVVFVQSKQDALRELQAATKDDPENFDVWRDLGDVSLAAGASAEAERAFRESTRIAHLDGNVSNEAESLMRFGDALTVRGHSAAAGGAYSQASKLIEQVLARDPANPKTKLDLSTSYMKIGNLLRDKAGDQDAALNSFRKSLAIVQDLAAAQPANETWQRELADRQIRIGDIMRDKGDRNNALQFYKDGLAVRRKLAAQAPDDAVAQRAVAISLSRVGLILLDKRDYDGALAAYREALATHKRILDRDPSNTGWQRDLAIAFSHVGDVFRDKGEPEQAFSNYQEALVITQKLATSDPQNTLWQRDLAIVNDRIGDVRRNQHKWDDALAAYQQGFDVRKKLSNSDTANIQWQRGMLVSYSKFGDLHKDRGERDKAVADYRKALDVAHALTARDASNVVWQCDLAEMLWDLADLGIDQRTNLQTIVQTLEPFDQKGLLSKQQQTFLPRAKKKLAALP